MPNRLRWGRQRQVYHSATVREGVLERGNRLDEGRKQVSWVE